MNENKSIGIVLLSLGHLGVFSGQIIVPEIKGEFK